MAGSFSSREDAAAAILEVGRRMYQRGFVAANDGNLSVRVGEDRFLATPAGVSKGYMDEGMLVEVGSAGNVVAGSNVAAENRRPTSELPMHLRAYAESPDVGAVAHAHPPVATSFAVAGIPLDEPILSEALMLLGEVPLAPYATSGTGEVPESIAPFVTTHRAVLMANHGVLTWGADLWEAWHLMESVEHYATILLHSKYQLGQVLRLTPAQIERLRNR